MDFSGFENHYFIIHTKIQYSITILNLKSPDVQIMK